MNAKVIEHFSFQLHPMDNEGEAGYSYTVEADGHSLTVRNVWENCGVIREVAECSCGIVSVQSPGGGCWQYGHDQPRAHSFDEFHRELANTPIEWGN